MGVDGFVPHPNDNHFRLKSESDNSAFVTQEMFSAPKPTNQPNPKNIIGTKTNMAEKDARKNIHWRKCNAQGQRW